MRVMKWNLLSEADVNKIKNIRIKLDKKAFQATLFVGYVIYRDQLTNDIDYRVGYFEQAFEAEKFVNDLKPYYIQNECEFYC